MRKFFAAWCVLCAFVCCIVAVRVFADTITGTFKVSPSLSHTGTGTATTLKETIATLQTWSISGTTGATSLTKMWVKSATLAGASGTNYDLYGSLTDSFGQSVSFETVKALVVIAASSNYSTIAVGGAASNPWTNWVADSSDQIKLPASASFYLICPTTTGYAVSNGVSDTLAVTNNHATSNAYFDIYVLGIGS